MLIQCNNKGCFSSDHHLLDTDDNKVYCINPSCGKEVQRIPEPTKIVLKSLGQIRRKSKAGMQYPCHKCSHSDRPLLKSLAGGVDLPVCRKCGNKLEIHAAFVQAMKEIEGYRTMDETDGGKIPESINPTSGTTFVVAGTSLPIEK